MDPFIRLLIMMRRVAGRRIPLSRLYFLLALLAFAFSLALYEYFFGWPEALTVERIGIHRPRF